MKKIKTVLALTINSVIDYILYTKHSGLIFDNNTPNKLLAKITFNYHSLEKGFSMPEMRYKFGKSKITVLLQKIKLYLKKGYSTNHSQFIASCSVLRKYYLLHQESNIDISHFFAQQDFELIEKFSNSDIGGAIEFNKDNYFSKSEFKYDDFSMSRHSIRNFKNTPIEVDRIRQAVNLANYCPSACNRQSSMVYLVSNKKTIHTILKIQRGINATTGHIYQLLVVTSNRNYFYGSGERNQHFVDGGIFLQSLLLSLHHNKIGACPLHWSLNFQQDNKIGKLINSQKGEKVIALIAIGNIEDNFKVPASHRKNIEEIFKKID